MYMFLCIRLEQEKKNGQYAETDRPVKLQKI